MKTAVVIGGTGLVGGFLLKKLAQDASFNQIIAIVRSQPPAENTVFSSPNVRVLKFDFQSWQNLEVQIRSFSGSSKLCFFCCLGTTIKQAGSEAAFKKVDHEYVVEFSKLAQACKAEQLLIVSALGADKASSVFYNKIKGQTEFDSAENFKGKLHFFRPSLLLGDRKEFRFFERLAILSAPLYNHFLAGPLAKYKPVKASDVAKAMLLVSTKQASTSLIVSNSEIINLANQ